MIAAAAATAIALLTGCSTSPTDETANPTPSASESANPMPTGKPLPPKDADAKLVAFSEIAVASCDKVIADGAIAKSEGIQMITAPKAKAIDLVTDVAIVKSPDGKTTANYILGPEKLTGDPTPFVCSISGASYTDLISTGKSTRFTETAKDTWTWKDENMNVSMTIKDGMISSYTQTFKDPNGKDVKVSYSMTYGLTAADLKAFADAVANPTEPQAPPAPAASPSASPKK
jgi:major membrane immunogen (membrane-anchored lipoprotein)